MVRDDLAFITNTQPQAVATNGNVIFTTMSRKANCGIKLQDNNIILKKSGYYLVSGGITFTGAVGNASIQLYKNGSVVVGAISTESISTANTQVKTLPVNAIVRVFNGEIGLITLVNTGVALNITNASLCIEYKGNVCD